MEFIIIIFLWLTLSVVIGIAGNNREIGFAGAFFTSLFLSPICGLIITAFSDSKSEIEFRQKLFSLLEKKQINHDDL